METNNEQGQPSNTASNNSAPNDDIAALKQQLAQSQQLASTAVEQLKALRLEQSTANARDAFLKSIPDGVPREYADMFYAHATTTGALKIDADGWHWRGARDPIAGASKFWDGIPKIQSAVAPAPTQTTPVGIPIQSQPKPSLASIMGALTGVN